MSEILRVNIWRDKFTSDHLRVNHLSKLSTLSEPSIVKFIENQSEHLSKLTLYHLKKNVLHGDVDVLVNRAEFHCYFLEVSTRRLAC